MSNATCSLEECQSASHSRGYCRHHYRRLMAYGDPLGTRQVKPQNKCAVEGCTNDARTKSGELCKMHYHRHYRHGNIEANFKAFKTAGPSVYRLMYNPGHPVASVRGMAYVHRVMLFDAIGVGPHACHWCGMEVAWGNGTGATDNLCVDHLDGDKSHNVLSNLVPSCNRCNSGRAMQERHETIRAMGGWANNDTITALRDPKRRRAERIA